MSEALDSIEKELSKKKLYYLKRIDNLFKPYAQMTKEEVQRSIDDPHYCSREAERCYKEIAKIEEMESNLFWLQK